MAVYGSQYIENKVQELRYSATTAILFWSPKLGGMEPKPTTATVTIYNGSETLMSTTSTAFSLCTVETEAWMSFTSLTARFNLGATVTASTSGFTATIQDVVYTSSTGGLMYVTDIYKTPASGQVLTDNGDTPGTAKVGDSFYPPMFYVALNLATTSSYTIGENYHAKVRWVYGGQTRYDHVYFDIVYYPIDVMTTGRMIDAAHPDWRAVRPKEWRSWVPAIHAGHAELCRRIRALGNRAAFIVKREELQPYEQAFIEAVIARNHLGMPAEERAYWEKRAEAAWTSRGEFSYAASADDGEIDANPKVFTHRWTR